MARISADVFLQLERDASSEDLSLLHYEHYPIFDLIENGVHEHAGWMSEIHFGFNFRLLDFLLATSKEGVRHGLIHVASTPPTLPPRSLIPPGAFACVALYHPAFSGKCRIYEPALSLFLTITYDVYTLFWKRVEPYELRVSSW